MALRTQHLEQMASHYLGPVTSAVYGALLRVLERKEDPTRDVFKIDNEGSDDEDEATAKMSLAYDYEIVEHFDASIDPTPLGDVANEGLSANGTVANGDFGANHAAVESEDSDDEPSNGVFTVKQRKKRMQAIAKHLDLLAEHPKGFCIRAPGTGKASVDISSLTRSLIQSELDKMINARHGRVPTRVVRLLREKGKLEEKQIALMSLKRLKDVRQVLTNLHAYGLVETQELPKDATRQPPRSTYLWFFDEDRVKALYLQYIYRGISRLFQRMKAERQSDTYRTAVDKAERADVKGREAELLAAHERELVKQWRDVEERMLIQISRMDDLVALVRDFSGKDTSLDA